MARAGAQHPVHLGPETLQQVKGYERLDGTGEAPAVDPAGPPAVQQLLRQGQGQGYLLVPGVTRGDHVLEEAPAGEAGITDQRQKGQEVPGAQGLHLPLHPQVVLVDVDGPEDRPVPDLGPDLGQTGVKVRLRHLPEDLFAEAGADLPQLGGDGGVLVRQVRVVRAAVDDAQGITGGGEIEVHPLHHRCGVVLEVHGDHGPTEEAIWSSRPLGLPK